MRCLIGFGLIGRIIYDHEIFKIVGKRPALHKEPLVFEEVHPTQRSYK